MAQVTLVNEQIEGGRELIDQLQLEGFEVAVGFWALEPESEWYLYIASPVVESGIRAGYRRVHTTVRRLPQLGIDPFEIKLVGDRDPMAQAALREVTPLASTGEFTVQPPKFYRTAVHFNGSNLGGIGIEDAYIYPPRVPAA